MYLLITMSDRKHMRKIRERRIKAIDRQIFSHEEKIETEKPIKDTTIEYWKKEIEEKFKKIKQDDKKYLSEENE